MLYAVASLKDSPGASIGATALTATWPAQRTAVLAELDPAGGDIAARFGLELPPPLGLVSYAGVGRRDHGADALLAHCQILPPALPVLLGPPSAEQAQTAVSSLDAALVRAMAAWPDVDVVADCGRLYPHSPALAVVRRSRVLVLVSRPRPDSICHLVTALPALAEVASQIAVVLSGRGSLSIADVRAAVGVEVLGALPEDDAGAGLVGGRPLRRWPGLWRRLPLLAAAQSIARRLAEMSATPTEASPAVSSHALSIDLGSTAAEPAR